MASRTIADLVGTLKTTFRIALATITAAGLSAARTYTLPNKSGTFAMLDDVGGGGGDVYVDPWTYVFLGSNVTVGTTALADVTGLSFTATLNTAYEIEFVGTFTSAATTTGVALAVDLPSGTPHGIGYHTLTAATLGGFEQIADNATTGASAGVRAATTLVPLRAQFYAPVGATGGTVQLRLRSEIASSNVILQAGSYIKYRKASSQSTLQKRIVPITQADYDALVTPDANTLYAIVTTVPVGPLYQWVEITAAAYALITPDPETMYVING